MVAYTLHALYVLFMQSVENTLNVKVPVPKSFENYFLVKLADTVTFPIIIRGENIAKFVSHLQLIRETMVILLIIFYKIW